MSDRKDNTLEENALLAKMRDCVTVEQLDELFKREHGELPPHPTKGRHVEQSRCGCPLTRERYLLERKLTNEHIGIMTERQLLAFVIDNAEMFDGEWGDDDLADLCRARARELQANPVPDYVWHADGDIITVSVRTSQSNAPVMMRAFELALRQSLNAAIEAGIDKIEIDRSFEIGKYTHGTVKK